MNVSFHNWLISSNAVPPEKTASIRRLCSLFPALTRWIDSPPALCLLPRGVIDNDFSNWNHLYPYSQPPRLCVNLYVETYETTTDQPWSPQPPLYVYLFPSLMSLMPSPKRETNKCSTLIAGTIHQSVSFGAVVFRRKTFTLWGGPYKRSRRCGLNSRKLAFFISGTRGFGTHAVLAMRQSVVACRWKMCFCSGVVLVWFTVWGVLDEARATN